MTITQQLYSLPLTTHALPQAAPPITAGMQFHSKSFEQSYHSASSSTHSHQQISPLTQVPPTLNMLQRSASVSRWLMWMMTGLRVSYSE